MSTKHKVVLITGGSRGLGKSSALKVAEKGLDVIITYHSKENDAHQVIDEIREGGRKAAALHLDIGDTRTFDEFYKRLEDVLKVSFDVNRFDYLVNNAGIGITAPFSETTLSQFEELMDVNFKGTYFFTQKALGFLNDGGGIVNLSSRLAQASVPGASAYAAMKGAIETLTRYQAKELGPRGIKVNCVAPGPIPNDFNGGMIRNDEQYMARIKALTVLGRLAEPDDIGGVVGFLCTADARWITGQRIEVSGGMGL